MSLHTILNGHRVTIEPFRRYGIWAGSIDDDSAFLLFGDDQTGLDRVMDGLDKLTKERNRELI